MESNQPVLREARLEDCHQVQDLQRKAGLEADSPEDWKRIWQENPSKDQSIPIGWVLEDNSKVVGFLGNVPLSYDLGGRSLKAVAGRGWAVDPSYRNHALKLFLVFMSQKNFDLILNASGNETAFQIFKAFGYKPLPLGVYSRVLFWVLRGETFFASAFKKLNFSKAASEVMGSAIGYLFRIKLVFDRIRIDYKFKWLRRNYEIKISHAGELNRNFDDLWLRKVSEKKRFLADRRSETLNWHFSGLQKSVKIIGCYKKNELIGYLALAKRLNEKMGYLRYQVIDVFVSKDNRLVLELLFIKAHQVSREDGVDALEITGFPENIRDAARKLWPMSRKSYPTPFTYKIINRELSEDEFGQTDIWYPSLYDGDCSL